MKKLEVKSYNFRELSQGAYNVAYENWKELCDYDSDLHLESLSKFCEVFNVDIINFDDDGLVNFDLMVSEETKNIRGIVLKRYLMENHFNHLFIKKVNYSENEYGDKKTEITFINTKVLTDHYFDDLILEPIYNFLENMDSNTTLKGLIGKCLYTWVHYDNQEEELCTSYQAFEDYCKYNNTRFNKDGEIIS